jgi:hypothetical protein
MTVGETAAKNFRSPSSRSAALISRRAAIEKTVTLNWSLKDPLDHEANWEECCRIGDILRTAGLFAQGSSVAPTVRNCAIRNGLMKERVYASSVSTNPNPA